MALNRPQRRLRSDGGQSQLPIEPTTLEAGDVIDVEDGPTMEVNEIDFDPLAAADEPEWRLHVVYEDGFDATISAEHLATVDGDVEVR